MELNMSNHANHFGHIAREVAVLDVQQLTNRVAATPKVICEEVVNNHDLAICLLVGGIEVASRHKTHAQASEEIRKHRAMVRHKRISFLRGCPRSPVIR